MHPGEFIRDRRVALGFEPEDVAQQAGLNVSSYYDLEQVETELQSVVSLAEIARLENLLGFDVRTILSGWKGPTTPTLQDLAEVTKAHLQRTNQTVEEFENAVGWEVRPMLGEPEFRSRMES
jgi:transcriptional regulator with XRE-family HTH domain